jgi:1-pyrroline-5-carboxylate dehydrogenase
MSDAAKVTYTTVASSEETHRAFEEAAAAVRADFGRLYESAVGGVAAADGGEIEVRSPIDGEWLVGRVQGAGPREAAHAVELAHAAFPRWRGLGWRRRVRLLRRAADLLAERQHRLAALMAYEIGKTRLEALGEVAESADLLRYYAGLMEESGGYRREMARLQPQERTASVLVPYGVFAVVAPFNFPSALAAGMIGAALVAGNTVVFKPATAAPLSGVELCRALWEAGVPPDVLHLVPGSGEEVGAALLGHPRTAGVAFTGSYEVGMRILRGFGGNWPKPVIAEMGGKNPAVVAASADLDAAAEGVARSAFGFGGQKCSACSRAYVVEEVFGPFVERLAARTAGLQLGNPLERDVFLGPLIGARAVATFEAAVGRAREDGAEVLCGGRARRDGDLVRGHFVEATVAVLRDTGHPLFHEELFVPLLLVAPVRDVAEAVALANRAPYGLTAGLFSRDPVEVRAFLDGIEAGVTYVNRRSGATTGAWPGVNPFGGWKASGSTGPAALGPYYLLRFLREQSRTINDVDLPGDD